MWPNSSLYLLGVDMKCKICGRDDTGYPSIGITVTKWVGGGEPPEDFKNDPANKPHACNPERHREFTKIMFDAVKRDY